MEKLGGSSFVWRERRSLEGAERCTPLENGVLQVPQETVGLIPLGRFGGDHQIGPRTDAHNCCRQTISAVTRIRNGISRLGGVS